MQSDTSIVTSEIIDAFKCAKNFENDTTKDLYIQIIVDKTADSSLICGVRDFLVPQASHVVIEVDLLEEINCQRPVAARDFAIIIAGDNAHKAGLCAHNLSLSHIPCVIVVDDINRAPEASVVDSTDDCPVSLVEAQDKDTLQRRLGLWMVDVAAEKELLLARIFPGLKDIVADSCIKQCALENTIIAAIPFIGSADMPMMVANQIKMAITIASANKKDINLSIAPEVLAVIGSGYLFRSLARLVPNEAALAKKGAKVGISYAGTYIIGKSLQSYYEVRKNFKTYLSF